MKESKSGGRIIIIAVRKVVFVDSNLSETIEVELPDEARKLGVTEIEGEDLLTFRKT